jgi:hypothetical protein
VFLEFGCAGFMRREKTGRNPADLTARKPQIEVAGEQ